MDILRFILIGAVAAAVIYSGLAAVLILAGKGKPSGETTLAFDKLLAIDFNGLPALQSYPARDGASLAYRYYPAESSDKVLVLLHGSGWHSRYFLPLARFIRAHNLAHVYTPDLRGHGEKPQTRGDIAYINQFEDDIADLNAMIRQQHPNARLIMGGHSSGGGLALRFAASQYGNQAAAYLMLAPYLQYNAPTVRPNSGGWATIHTGRIIGLTMLNSIGIKAFNALPVIAFDMPPSARDGTETLQYSYRLNTGYAPQDYKNALASITQPFLLVAGSNDEAFFADQFEPTVSALTAVQVEIIDGESHMGVVTSEAAFGVIRAWFQSLN